MTDILFVSNLSDTIKEEAYRYFKDSKISQHTVFYITELLQDPGQIPQEYLAFDKAAGLGLAEANELEGEEAFKEYKNIGDASLISTSIFRESVKDMYDYYCKIGAISYLSARDRIENRVFKDIYQELSNYYEDIAELVHDFWRKEIEYGIRTQ